MQVWLRLCLTLDARQWKDMLTKLCSAARYLFGELWRADLKRTLQRDGITRRKEGTVTKHAEKLHFLSIREKKKMSGEKLLPSAVILQRWLVIYCYTFLQHCKLHCIMGK